MSAPRRVPVVPALLAPDPTQDLLTDVLVVGTGVAGLSVAHGLLGTGLRVDLVSKGPLDAGSTRWAQGGVAVGGGQDDAPALHVADTVAAAAGLADEAVVRTLVDRAPAALDTLLRLGARFDGEDDGSLARTLEGGHSRRRIVHAGGDATGAEVQRALQAAVTAAPSGPRLHESTMLLDLLTHEGCVVGALLARLRPDGSCAGVLRVSARAVVLATGGHGQVYDATTNPAAATGDGLAAALRAGAPVADVEFVQFHPTALAVRPPGETRAQRPLVTEALRGEGAVLLDVGGERVMPGRHPLADLAPRDVVAAAIAEAMASTGAGHVLLDARHLGAALLERRFPTVLAACRAAGVDPAREPVPVVPAAHFACGGVVAGLDGRTGLDGLLAVGEVARTGVHGANRLASNSLLEGLVAGAAAAALLAGDLPPRRRVTAPREGGALVPASVRGSLTAATARDAGVLRSQDTLARSGSALADLLDATVARALPGVVPGLAAWEAANLHTVASALVAAALHRQESRGCHRRSDHPEPDEAWRRSTLLTGEPAVRPGNPTRSRLEVAA